MNKISDLKVGEQVALKNGDIDIFVSIRRGCKGAILKNYHHTHNYQIDWQKTNELNNKQMKEFIIECPSGFEVDEDKSTFEKIVFKEIENKLPMSVEEIPNRKGWYIDSTSKILCGGSKGKNNISTYERAEAFLALMQLVELRDAWNGDWKADYNNGNQPKFCVMIGKGLTIRGVYALHFKSGALRDQFAEQFKDLIEQAKELL